MRKISCYNKIKQGDSSATIVLPKVEVKKINLTVKKISHANMRLSKYIGVRATIIGEDSNVKKIIKVSDPIKSNTGIGMLISSIKGVK